LVFHQISEVRESLKKNTSCCIPDDPGISSEEQAARCPGPQGHHGPGIFHWYEPHCSGTLAHPWHIVWFFAVPNWGVLINDPHLWMVYNGNSYESMDDLEVAHILGNLQIAIVA
jgi:hypothetical protein